MQQSREELCNTPAQKGEAASQPSCGEPRDVPRDVPLPSSTPLAGGEPGMQGGLQAVGLCRWEQVLETVRVKFPI